MVTRAGVLTALTIVVLAAICWMLIR